MEDTEDKTQVIIKKEDFSHFAFLVSCFSRANLKSGDVFKIDKSFFKIGSSDRNDLQINLIKEPNSHIVISFSKDSNSFLLEDFLSKDTSLFVNDNVVPKNNSFVLSDNDFIRFLDLELVFKKVW